MDNEARGLVGAGPRVAAVASREYEVRDPLTNVYLGDAWRGSDGQWWADGDGIGGSLGPFASLDEAACALAGIDDPACRADHGED